MKKTAYILLVFLMACSNKSTSEKKDNPIDTSEIPKDSVKTEIKSNTLLLDYAGNVLKAIKENDIEKITGYIHPSEGIRFSPYISVDTKTDIKMTAQEFKEQWAKKATQKIDWGSYSSGEDQIKMTIKEYFKKFVYDLDFLALAKPTLNSTQASGTMMSNISDIYPGADFVEYYIPGVDKTFDGMDWRALTLVFKKDKGTYYLVGIVHGEWTT